MNKHIKVKSDVSLVRDVDSNAIISKNQSEFDKFIKPSSLAKYVRDAGAELLETKGMFYNPLTHKANLNNDLGVNYLMYARKS